MRRLPAEPSSFMAGAPLVMYDGEWRAEEGEEWERVVRGGGATRVTAGRLMEWRGAVGAKDDGDDSLLPTVDGFRGDGGELAPRLAGGCSALKSLYFSPLILLCF